MDVSFKVWIRWAKGQSIGCIELSQFRDQGGGFRSLAIPVLTIFLSVCHLRSACCLKASCRHGV